MVNIKELDPEEGPLAAYGARLRAAREARGWTQEQLADRMKYSGQHISALETARKPPTLRSSVSADMAFGIAGKVESFKRAYYEIKRGSLMEGFPEYLMRESQAAEIRLFDAGLVPGLLQTHAYAQELANGAVQRDEITPEQAAERVEFLIERQAALVQTPPPLIFAVLDESCIRRPIGDQSVMDEQLARLIEFSQLSNTSLQIAPYSMGALRPFDRLVNLLTMHDRSLMAYTESQSQGYLDRELTSVVPLMKRYHQLQTHAASQAESVAMIEQLRKGTP
ncbi:helix-turn-helix domain-containing protein [Streptomyces inusitatus]|nr:helix-turn-helix transcriptional regulator [Streptomyces inusitatus]